MQKRAKKVHDESDFKIAYSNIRGVIFIWQKRKKCIALWSLCDEDKPYRAIGRVMFYSGTVMIYYSSKPASFNCLRWQLLFYNTNAAEIKHAVKFKQEKRRHIGQHISKEMSWLAFIIVWWLWKQKTNNSVHMDQKNNTAVTCPWWAVFI